MKHLIAFATVLVFLAAVPATAAKKSDRQKAKEAHVSNRISSIMQAQVRQCLRLGSERSKRKCIRRKQKVMGRNKGKLIVPKRFQD